MTRTARDLAGRCAIVTGAGKGWSSACTDMASTYPPSPAKGTRP